MVWNFFNKKTSNGAVRSNTLASQDKSAIMQNKQLVEELHKPVIRKFEKEKIYSLFKDNIWGAHITFLLMFIVNMYGLYL